MFVTAVLCSLNTSTGELTFACGGHEPPVKVPCQGQSTHLEAEGGPLLALLDGSDYPLNRVTLQPGEAVVLFTDGVGEAQNVDGDFFGPERLREATDGGRDEGTPELTGRVLNAVRAFAGDAPQSDDITILTVQVSRTEGEAERRL
jgi:phosphoserine phosphatase RsbU/P